MKSNYVELESDITDCEPRNSRNMRNQQQLCAQFPANTNMYQTNAKDS